MSGFHLVLQFKKQLAYKLKKKKSKPLPQEMFLHLDFKICNGSHLTELVAVVWHTQPLSTSGFMLQF